ncbi:oligosaccharide flippase family protein [Vibrio cholerae]|nr:oligosaccharide flippase family protein [Vibrio cholerae]
MNKNNIKFQHIKIKNPFIAKILALMGGTAISQVLIIASLPILSRLYSPYDFGVLGAFTAYTSVLAPIACLCLASAILLPKQEKIAKLHLNTAFVTTITLSLTLLAFLLIVINVGFEFIEYENDYWYILLIVTFVLFSGVQQSLEKWFGRSEKFKALAKANVAATFIMILAKVFCGVFYPSSLILVITSSIYPVLYCLLITITSNTKINSLKFTDLTLNKLRFSFFKNFDFVRYQAPQVLLSCLSQSIPIFILGYFFSAEVVGFYAMARGILSAPSMLIGKSVGDVFFPRMAKSALTDRNEMRRLFILSSSSLAIIGLPIFSIVLIFGGDIFSLVLGEKWFISGEYASILSIWLYFAFLNSPSNQVLQIIGMQKYALKFTIGSLLIRSFCMLGVMLLNNEPELLILCYALSGALLNIYLIMSVYLNLCRWCRED